MADCFSLPIVDELCHELLAEAKRTADTINKLREENEKLKAENEKLKAEKAKRKADKICGRCDYYTGAMDWNLCCSKPPHKANKLNYPCGFLCCADTPADDCENFTTAINRCDLCTYEMDCTRDRSLKCHKYKRDAKDGGFYG